MHLKLSNINDALNFNEYVVAKLLKFADANNIINIDQYSLIKQSLLINDCTIIKE